VSEVEPLEDFRARARSWIAANLERDDTGWGGVLRDVGDRESELALVQRDRDVQRQLFDAGLAGICVPTRYGGQGLTPAHQAILNEEIDGSYVPRRFQVPTFSPCMAVLLEFGTEAQKEQHVPAMLRGDELWMQLLSEPSGGSDVAGALTSAVRDGDEWILNGSKVWTTGAWWSDWGLCLARTNWEVPKHRGLSVFIFPLHQDGIEVHRIELLNGSKEFCQEFISDVRVPDTDRVGEVDDGWTVGTRWMFFERMFTNSPYVTVGATRGMAPGQGPARSALSIARQLGTVDDPRVRDLVGQAEVLHVVGEALSQRVAEGITTRTMSDQASALGKLYHGTTSARTNQILFELSGATAGAWADDDGEAAHRGIDFLLRQTGSIGGGTTEMARNVISERLLGMPRELRADQVAFRDVPR
jgi:alkylation response protein AidB-like acyl-CoA dehydrogenase